MTFDLRPEGGRGVSSTSICGQNNQDSENSKHGDLWEGTAPCLLEEQRWLISDAEIIEEI